MKHLSTRRYVDIKHIYVMLTVDSGSIRLVSVRTTDMNTDFLTKPLAPKDLKRAIDVINIIINKVNLVTLK